MGAIAVCILKGASALSCKTCEAKDYAGCASAVDVTCPPAEVDGEGTLQEYSCASMEHRRQGSKVDHVVMGCKQQCWNSDPRKVSKCRACCETDGCNQAVIDAG